ncbi:phosphatase PAP2 family protein [Hyphobacterium sp. CCMP332]|nr:phosphatase PAP2 family protein [Hyphobacterium sp. CCMP332]
MLEILIEWDKQLFFFINSHNSPFWDAFMKFMSDKGSWYILYAIIIAFLIYSYKKHIWLPAIMIGLTILIADQTSSGFLKPTVERHRPCKDPEIGEMVRTPGGCGGLYGFTSSHASNHFGIAVLLILMGRNCSKWVWLFLPWAALIAYSRVYLGVHYPGDVIVGGLIGVTAAFIAFYIGKWISTKTGARLKVLPI